MCCSRLRLSPLAALTAVLAIVVLGSQLPSPLYAVYATRLGLSSAAVTVLFAVYAAGVLLALLTCGHLSDHVGRKPVAAVAIGLSAISDATFALSAATYPGLLVGRVLSGFAIGAATGAIAAHLLESADPGRRARAAQVSGFATVVGGGAGGLLAGVLAQWSPAPTVVPYVADLVLLALAAVLLATVPETVADRRGARPRAPRVTLPSAGRRAFSAAGGAAFCGFAVFGLTSALTGTFLKVALGQSNRVLAGAVPFLIGLAAAVAPPLLRRLAPLAMTRLGLAGFVPTLALLAAGIASRSLVLFLLAMVLAGATFGAAFQGGLRLLHAIEHPRRGELFSSFYTAAYAGMVVPVIGAGVLADRLDPTTTVAVFGGVIAALALAALAFTREPAARPAPVG